MQSIGERIVCLQHDRIVSVQGDGVRWGWNPEYLGRIPLELGYNLDGMPPEYRGLCLEALRRWAPGGHGIQMTLAEKPASANKTIVFVWAPLDWGTNYGMLGLAQFPWPNGPAVTIRINSVALWKKFSMLHVLVHEIGHGLGLLHRRDYGSIMASMYDEDNVIEWPSFRDYMYAAEMYAVRPIPNIGGIR